MASARVVWTNPPSLLAARVVALGAAVLEERRELLAAVAVTGEAYAKVNAPWTNRTGAARAGLHGTSDDDSVAISHGVDYGVWLELAHAGVWGIIPATLQVMAADVERGLAGILERAGRGFGV